MPYREIPKTVQGLQKALTDAKLKSDSELSASRTPAFSDTTRALLDTFLPNYNTQISEMSTALQGQANASLAEDQQFAVAKMFISHFIQVFNFGVERGAYPASARAFYGLDVNQTELPVITKENDIIFWGNKLVTGEASRITAGGSAMVNPAIAEVQTAITDFTTKHSEQSLLKDTFDTEQEDVAALFESARQLVIDIWDEVEFTFRHETASSLRKKAREYGVYYALRPGEPPEENNPTPP